MVNIVVAAGINNAIGKDNKLLWHLPDDLKFFKQVTMGHPIVMGRATFESVGRPLPGRRNIILSRDNSLNIPGCEVLHAAEEVFKLLENEKEIMIVGGDEIYRLFLPFTQRIFLTRVFCSPDADRFFPELSSEEWKQTESNHHEKDEKHPYAFTFETWERIA